jgi:hypothetical protein
MSTSQSGLAASGKTTNFSVSYETALYDTLPAAQQASVQANLIANADALLAVVENEFNVTTGWFNTPAGKFGSGNRQSVDLSLPNGSGASNGGYGSTINTDAQAPGRPIHRIIKNISLPQTQAGQIGSPQHSPVKMFLVTRFMATEIRPASDAHWLSSITSIFNLVSASTRLSQITNLTWLQYTTRLPAIRAIHFLSS